MKNVGNRAGLMGRVVLDSETRVEWRARSRARWILTLWVTVSQILPGIVAETAAAPDRITVISQSGQFVVHGLPIGRAPTSQSTSAVDYLRIDPNLAAVSLDRIRTAVYEELRLPNEWRGRITVVTEPVRREDTRVEITAVRFQNGWGYRLVLPELLDRARFLDAAANIILLEVANRRAVGRKAEVPEWLVQGLSAELEATALSTLALEPGAEVNRRERNPDALAGVRSVLRRHTGLSFDDLSMPTEEQLSGPGGDIYRACAQLFVHALLRSNRSGRDSLRDFLIRLPEHLNWQTTFLEVFHNQFPRLVDVDKWYSLQVVQAGGRDALSFFPLPVTCAQLDDILLTPIEIRATTNDLPSLATIRLQAVIAQWEFVRQHPVLVEKIRRLRGLQGRAAAEAVSLIEDYTRALMAYVGTGNLAAPATEKQRARLRAKGNPDVVLRRLDELDLERATLHGSATAASIP